MTSNSEMYSDFQVLRMDHQNPAAIPIYISKRKVFDFGRLELHASTMHICENDLWVFGVFHLDEGYNF